MIGGMWGRRGRVNDNARGLMGKQGDPLAIHCDERLRCLQHPSRGGADGAKRPNADLRCGVATGSTRQVEKHGLS